MQHIERPAARAGHASRQRPPPPRPQSIGALCDEMGIGKTLEVCALMLRRPCPVSQAPRAGAGATQAPEGLQQAPPGQSGSLQGPAHSHPGAAPSALCGQEAEAGSSEAAEAAQDAPAAAAPSQESETPEPPRMANLVVCPEELIPQWAYEVSLQKTCGPGRRRETEVVLCLASEGVLSTWEVVPLSGHCGTQCILSCRLEMYR